MHAADQEWILQLESSYPEIVYPPGSPSPPMPKNRRATQQATTPSTFKDVIDSWNCDWLWKDLQWNGRGNWIERAIKDKTLIAVTDGSYMNNMYPSMNSCAFILECTKGRGRLSGGSPELLKAAGAYRGELLGLLAIHLILLAINTIKKDISGLAKIYSDCLGALSQVTNLPSNRIPSKCKHSNILKIIMINCKALSFKRKYIHVAAHQNDNMDFGSLSRPSQLNCACDYAAKRILLDLCPLDIPQQKRLPLEAVSVWAGKEKISTDQAHRLRYYAHRQLAREEFAAAKVLTNHQFEKVDWEMVHQTLNSVPRMFQIFACKQVFDVAGTN
jgi:hypothetical protein